MCVYVCIYIYIHTLYSTDNISQQTRKGEVLLGGVSTLRYLSILGESSACRVPIRAVAAW